MKRVSRGSQIDEDGDRRQAHLMTIQGFAVTFVITVRVILAVDILSIRAY